jgi:hypothetical protein
MAGGGEEERGKQRYLEEEGMSSTRMKAPLG